MSDASWIDEFLPTFDVVERHSIVVRATPERAYETARGVDMSGSLAAKVLFGLRGLPRLLAGRGMPSTRLDLAAFEKLGFVFLAEEAPAEFVLGVVGRFWRIDSDIVPISPNEFLAFERPGFAKGALNVRVRRSGTSTLVSTETRVLCLDDTARRSFGRYWRLIGPFSAYLRRILLAEIKRAAEAEVRPLSPR